MDSITLVFDAKTLDYIANVLSQRPYAEVAQVLQNIANQVKLQGNPAPDPVPAADAAKQNGSAAAH